MKRTVHVIQWAVVFAAALVLVGCGVPKSEHDALKDKHKKSTETNVVLKERIKGLEKQVDKLTAENKALKENHQKLLDQNKAEQEKKKEAEKAEKEEAAKAKKVATGKEAQKVKAPQKADTLQQAMDDDETFLR
ncbi:MAG: hypothetical protein ABIH74_04605 [Candidatus Omnitrophota bacterium]